MKVLIIDDEPIAQDILTNFCNRIPFIEIIGCCDDAIAGMQQIRSMKPDLVFLDIQMPEMTGVEMLRAIKDRSAQIIFTTAFPEYALDGFDLDIVDYLLKPIPFERFAKATNKAHEYFLSKSNVEESSNHHSTDSEYVWVKEGRKHVQIAVEDILLVEAMSDYMNLILKDQKVTIHGTMNWMESVLQPPTFIRINRSTIVRTSSIRSIEDLQVEVKIKNYSRISIGPTYRDKVKSYLNHWEK